MPGTLCLRTDRLILRPLTQADAPRLQEIAGVPEVARMMSSIPLPWTDAAVADWIGASLWRGHIPFRLGIGLAGGSLVGSLGIGPDHDIAFFLGRDHWGRGLATEALGLFIPWLMQSFDLPEITAEHLDDNPASGAVLRRLGFEPAGRSSCKSNARLDEAPSTLYRLTANALKARP